MKKIIGRIARYTGNEQNLDRVVIVAAMISGGSDDPDEHIYLKTDKEIAEAGGVAPTDRVEVRPIHPDGRVSWITCDPLYADLVIED
ncbi:MAG TPA: hypothetical protein PLN69_06610 [bacterium]|nr:hypothetical protein [bacterium]